MFTPNGELIFDLIFSNLGITRLSTQKSPYSSHYVWNNANYLPRLFQSSV
jgi:hypothetical protein